MAIGPHWPDPAKKTIQFPHGRGPTLPSAKPSVQRTLHSIGEALEARTNEKTLGRIISHSKCPITNQKKPYHDGVHCNDEPKQDEIHATQSLYFITGVSKFM